MKGSKTEESLQGPLPDRRIRGIWIGVMGCLRDRKRFGHFNGVWEADLHVVLIDNALMISLLFTNRTNEIKARRSNFIICHIL